MLKKTIPIFFSVTFLLVIVMPAVFAMVDDGFDTSIIFSVSEEEEKGCEKDLDIEFLLFDMNSNYSDFKLSEDGMVYFYRKYTKPNLSVIYPPPELYTL